MEVNKQLVERLAQLNRLSLTEAEKTRLQGDLQQILDFMDQLNELNTSAVEPLIYMTEAVNRWRADEARITITRDEALKNAPEKANGLFRVPKVLKHR